MKVCLQIEIILEGLPCHVQFSVIFDRDYGSYNYDWIINKISSRNHFVNWNLLDIRYKSMIESAIEERLYRFNFEDFDDLL